MRAAPGRASSFISREVSMMKLPHRRQLLHLAAGAAALPVLSGIARAEAYPTRPVRIMVGFAAGGGYDIVARLIGQWLSERFGQPFVIENRPGAATNIATQTVVNAPPDGYTLLLVGPTNAINVTLYQKLSFNFVRDIAPVASITQQPQAILANPSFPAKTIPEFIDYAKGKPGTINMSSPGVGSISHLAGELFKMMAGVSPRPPTRLLNHLVSNGEQSWGNREIKLLRCDAIDGQLELVGCTTGISPGLVPLRMRPALTPA
jgi:tripartite-type tricarboxylate transporter receptor subunit TctC